MIVDYGIRKKVLNLFSETGRNCFDIKPICTGRQVYLLTEDKEEKILSKSELYAMLLKEYEEFPDEGREYYLKELLEELRKELESTD